MDQGRMPDPKVYGVLEDNLIHVINDEIAFQKDQDRAVEGQYM
jgi:hypothetical protein